jgi:hypothetical protein
MTINLQKRIVRIENIKYFCKLSPQNSTQKELQSKKLVKNQKVINNNLVVKRIKSLQNSKKISLINPKISRRLKTKKYFYRYSRKITYKIHKKVRKNSYIISNLNSL